MKYLKLDKKDSEDLYNFLKELKRNNWIVDMKTLFDVYDWFVKTTGYTSAYENIKDSLTQFSKMTKDLCDYFRAEIVIENMKRCGKCRKSKAIDNFLGNKWCKLCTKKTSTKRILKRKKD